MAYIDVSDLSFQRLQQLVADGTPEDRHLEYKREIGSGREMAKDISAFANSEGGLILYGIAQGEGSQIELSGIDPAGATEAVDNVVANALSPRVNTVTKLIPLPGTERAVLAVWVPDSDLKPHMVSAYEDRRYYARRNTANIPMDQLEVQEAYRLRTKAEDEAEAFAGKIIDSRYATRYPEHAWASLIAVPRFIRDDLVPIDQPTSNWLMAQLPHFGRLFTGYPHVGPRGFQIYLDEENVPQFRFATIGVQGYVEMAAVMDAMHGKAVPSYLLAELAIQFLRFSGLLYERLSYNGMVKLFLGVDQVGTRVLALDQRRFWFGNQAKLQANEVHVYRNEAAASLRSESDRVCKLFMDRVYQAAGIMSCDYFGPDGKLQPYR